MNFLLCVLHTAPYPAPDVATRRVVYFALRQGGKRFGSCRVSLGYYIRVF